MTSTDGATWRPLQPLFSGALPKGAGAGYTRNPDGSVEIETMAGGFFALLPETAPPPAPAAPDAGSSHAATSSSPGRPRALRAGPRSPTG